MAGVTTPGLFLLASFGLAPHFCKAFSPRHPVFRRSTFPPYHCLENTVSSDFINIVALTSTTDDQDDFRIADKTKDREVDGQSVEDKTHARTYEDFKERLETLSFLSSMDTDAANLAQSVIDEMREAHLTSGDESLRPDVEIWNLLIDAHAWTDPVHNRKGGQRAMNVLEIMEKASDDDADIPNPNVDSYITVMDGWANRRQPLKAEEVFVRLQARYDKTRDESVRPNTEVYNALIRAWVKSKEKLAPAKAEGLLNEMLDRFHGGDDAARPNVKTFERVMNCHAHTREASSVEKVQRLLQRMSELHRQGIRDLKPNYQVYNSLIKAYTLSRGVEKGAAKAEAILFRMIEMNNAGDESMRPDTACFINVVNGWRASGEKVAARKAEKLLELQEGMCEGPDDALKPNARVYNGVMEVIARSKGSDKAERARRIVEKMKALQSRGDGDSAPNLRSYIILLNACAFTKGDREELMAAFRIAVGAINELRDSTVLSPDHVSYGMFLKACANLMPPSKKRDAVVESVFWKCCHDGWVSDFVLECLTAAGSEDLCRKILGGTLSDGVNIPAEWSQNVKSRR